VGEYKALLVANSTFYEDASRLPTLKAPVYDMDRLHGALVHPEVGLFERNNVRLLPNGRSTEIIETMADFFLDAQPDDTLLFYYSGHGQLDINNDFFLCAANTRVDRLVATAVSDQQTNKMIQMSPARTFVLILDCCSSGAWKGGLDLLPETLKGTGRFLLASSRRGQNSGDAAVETESSPFTEVLVEALEVAPVDTDVDGYVDIEEVYKYVDAHMSGGQEAQHDFHAASRSVALARRGPIQPIPPSFEEEARQLVEEGLGFARAGRPDDAVESYDRVIFRFGDSPEPGTQAQVAAALLNKAALRASEGAVSLYDEIISRYGDALDPAINDQVAKARSRKERLQKDAREAAERKAKAEAERTAKALRKVERRNKVRREIRSIKANKSLWTFVAWVGVVFGYLFYIYPGVVARRQVKRWEVDPSQPPWLAWTIGSLVTISIPFAIISAAVGGIACAVSGSC